MGFHNIRFPQTISYGSRGGPGYNTSIAELSTGQEERVSRWSSPKYRYDVVEGIQSAASMMQLIEFYHARGGAEHSFRFIDPRDCSTASDHVSAPSTSDVLLGTGDGSTKIFQLKKVYSDAAASRTRNITKPIHNETLSGPILAGTLNVLVEVNGTPLASGWSVDANTGEITFTTAPTVGHDVRAGCYFDVPVRFGESLDLSMSATWRDFNTDALESVPLVEDPDPLPVNEELNYGGASNLGTVTSNVALSQLDGLLQTYTCNTSGVRFLLPDETSLPFGGPYFMLCNLGGTNTVELWNHDETTLIGTMLVNALVQVFLAADNAGARVWVTA